MSRGEDFVTSDRPVQGNPDSIRVLVADDFEPWRTWLCSFLSRDERLHVVGLASDGAEAIQKVDLLRPDLILLDIGLPKLNGIEVAHRIAKCSKIIFVTGESDPDVAGIAMSNGAMGYVLKRKCPTQLIAAIEIALRGDKFVSREVRGYATSFFPIPS